MSCRTLIRFIILIIFVLEYSCTFSSAGSFPPKEKDKRNSWFRVSMYIEGLGKSQVYSVNLEYRFKKWMPRFALNAGYGYARLQPRVFLNRRDSIRKYSSFPVGFNILFGNRGNYLEFGLGFTRVEKTFEFYNVPGSLRKYDFYYCVLGYRFHGLKGYQFRLYYSPAYGEQCGFMPYYAGISMGYIFGAMRAQRLEKTKRAEF